MLYLKMGGKFSPHQLVWISAALSQELTWFAGHVESSNSVHLLSSHCWDARDANITVFCNASLVGLGFWCPALNIGFIHELGASLTQVNIFSLEALTIVSALQWVVGLHTVLLGCQIAIHTNNVNTVAMFNSLHAQP